MGWWTDHLVPRLTDVSLSAPEISELRVRVCAGLSGRVLEIGFGSGLNLPHLPGTVDSLDAVEPSDLGWSRSCDRRAGSEVPVERIGLDGQVIDAADASYDAALVTFSLCTIPDVERALSEVRRVLRPGGTLHFLEHGRSPDVGVARWQRRLDPLQGLVCGGCHLTRDIPALVQGAGFTMEEVEERHLIRVPAVGKPWAYGFLGRGRLST
ncbi:methyltransferase domain-containing protein [Nocardioides sp. JQ2195]|uniref:class I SAM-dependent methyltransferase n=1 Tax=Nocardioides sp. JQ2195 TaxID=2592334 RepID=UPI00143ECA44|nr:methyltransferase domain-containing protein [Nocardioides sp. JQ2195]QIX26706.1 methyltransferase domain-containing protein [Nocardioides sp. JQ2195]